MYVLARRSHDESRDIRPQIFGESNQSVREYAGLLEPSYDVLGGDSTERRAAGKYSPSIQSPCSDQCGIQSGPDFRIPQVEFETLGHWTNIKLRVER